MATTIETMSMNVKSIAKDTLILKIKVTGLKEMTLRFKLAGLLCRLAAKMAGCQMDFDIITK